MKLNIEVDSGSFEKVISDGIEAMSKEDLGEIIKKVVYEAFTKCEKFESMLVKTVRNGGWSSGTHEELGPLAEAAVKSIDMSKELEPFKEQMVRALMDNHRKLVEDLFMKCFIEQMFNGSQFQDMMRGAVMHIVDSEIRRRSNNVN